MNNEKLYTIDGDDVCVEGIPILDQRIIVDMIRIYGLSFEQIVNDLNQIYDTNSKKAIDALNQYFNDVNVDELLQKYPEELDAKSPEFNGVFEEFVDFDIDI